MELNVFHLEIVYRFRGILLFSLRNINIHWQKFFLEQFEVVVKKIVQPIKNLKDDHMLICYMLNEL